MQSRATSFTDISVREILERLKWQTRRIVRGQPPPRGLTETALAKVKQLERATLASVKQFKPAPNDGWWLAVDGCHGPVKCPYGVAGDQLWVKETWGLAIDGMGWMNNGATLNYRADGYQVPMLASKFDLPNTVGALYSRRGGWRGGRFMPRWAARLVLEVTDVKIERLQQVTRADAVAEGCRGMNPREEYRKRWESMHGPESWRESPWVWAVSFKVIEPMSATSSAPRSRRNSTRRSTGGTSTASTW